MMIDTLSSTSPGVKTSTGPQSVRHSREAVAHPSNSDSSEKAADTVTHEAVAAAVKEMNDFVKPAVSSVEFSVDDDTGRTIVKMIDTETNKVVRQFPTEEALAISKSLDRLQGLTVNVKA